MGSDWFFALVMFVSMLGTTVSVILYLVNRNRSFSPKILAAIIFSLSYVLFAHALFISREFVNFPHLWRTPVFLSIAIAPLTYIYVRSVLAQQFSFKKWDFLFFVPALLYTMQFIPMYLLPREEKIKILLHAFSDPNVAPREPEGMLPEGLGLIFRLTYCLVIFAASFKMLLKWQKKMRNSGQVVEQNKEIVQWLFYLLATLSTSYLLMILEVIFHLSKYFELTRVMSATVAGSIIFICFFLLVRPNILYGLKGWFPVDEPVDEAGDELPDANLPVREKGKRKLLLTEDQGDVFRKIIDEHFSANKPYLKPGYTIRHLSEEVNIPTYQLSVFINQEYSKNFNEFINDARVDEVIELTSSNPEYFQYTLEGLGQQVGFQSRTAFIAAVKRRTGKTPSEFFGKRKGPAH
jgi:AraC-like DNA-binding protein